MPEAVEFHYELTGPGWSECRISIGEATCSVTASYLSDALGDLASAVEAVLRRHTEACASFEEEPGEYLWLFDPVFADRVHVRILKLIHWGGEFGDVWTLLFEAECERRAFASAVANELRRLLAEHGLSGYRRKWVRYEFPVDRLRAIEELLRARGA